MVKRMALFVVGVALMLGAFLLYQYLAGPDALGGRRPKTVIKSAPTTLPMTVEQRNAKGELEFVITATSAPTPMRDAAGNLLPGQFGLDKPLATFYEHGGAGGRIIQISADTGTAVIEKGPKGGNGSLGEIIATKGETVSMTVREGKLMGHVRMMISEGGAGGTGGPATREAGGKGAGNALAGGLRVYFDDDLHLDGIQEVLTTKGGIHVRGQTIGFDGEGMQLVFNRKAQRIEFLGIDKGNEVIVRKMGPQFLARADSTTQPATSSAAAGAAGAALAAATEPATQPKDVVLPTTYRMSFGQDVRVAVGQGELASTLTSEHMYMIFTASRTPP